MTDRDALYRAILDAPDDDTLRLVYADALEEGGDPRRAAFVRAQVELAGLPNYDPRAVHIRHHELRFDAQWVLGLDLPDGFDWAREPFRRGLPAAVQARDGGAFDAHADELFTRYPIEALELPVPRVQDARAMADSPWLGRLTSLTFIHGAGRQIVAPLLASPHLTRLTELRVGSEMTTPSAVSTIVRSPVARQLTALAVGRDGGAGRPEGSLATQLTRHARPLKLKRLDLSNNRLTAETIQQLVASPAVQALEELDVSDNNLRVAGLTALAGGALPNLRSLRLLRSQPQEEGVAALAASPLFGGLRSLSLGGGNLGPSAVTAVATAPADNLRVLDLHDNRVEDRGAVTLADSPHLANLVLLDLAETHIGDAGAAALAESPHLGGLIWLNLYGNPISDAAADRLRERFGERVYL
jgi:uncharacterized protein (TIGR02996 family)